MQLTHTLLASLLAASTALAAPAATEVSMMAKTPEWTITKMQRKCNAKDTECTWTFGIDTHAAVTGCKLVVKAASGASRANGGPSNCGDYTVTSGWSGQFGDGRGFTTLSVVDNKKRQIVWPAYTDNQVKDGGVVKPDQSYGPQNLPGN